MGYGTQSALDGTRDPSTKPALRIDFPFPLPLPIFWLPDFDQSVNSRKNSMDTGERTRSGTGSGEAE